MALQFAVSYAGGERMFIRARRWPFRIGRDPRNDLCLTESENVSRIHARITQQDGEHFLTVSGITPTFLNDQPVPLNEPLPLAAGDVIELPNYRVEIQDSAAQPRASNSTVALKAIPDDNRLIRLVASNLGLQQWSPEGILAWLQAQPGREIMIRQGHYQLCLMSNLNLERLRQRLGLFAELQDNQDPNELSVAATEAGPRAS
jgi:pSer/pThr/pTyr-binding forkhead associated (FHA) protein